ncbi:hypothetical protein Q8W71_31750 [Methylobacterium sp. NEAU 140]|uniref:hypothetical protein n=1 Tax=Methylobacterium sp. NEAU 140 TaxID=3064945 RepID=UPI002735654E|nr:hypothetical protein [Methylobacterium sp. NEAU 140]MDP4027155.1 hypothetical protein [Methylobacterium sp. NEAU 140]
MGEYVMTTVIIGGPLAGRAGGVALIAAAEAYLVDAGSLVHEALAEVRGVTFEGEQDYGLTPSLDAFCREHGLSYHRAWIARLGLFEAGVKHRSPGLEGPVEEAADEAGEPMITLVALRDGHDAGETLPDLLTRLERAVAAAVPPLSLAAPGAPEQAPA